MTVLRSPAEPLSPFYESEDVVLYHADCRSVLNRLDPVDLLVTDPPYGVNWQSGRGSHRKMAGDDGSLSLKDWLPTALRVLRRGRHAYVFGSIQEAIDPAWPLCGMTELIWDKGIIGPGDLTAPWGPQHERILFGVQEISKANREKNYGVGAARLRKGSVLRVQRRQSGQTLRHPSEKPVDLLRILIESSSTFNEVVLDPFAGSGSTLVAARLEGRRSIGIELDEAYCEVAATRLEEM